MEEPAHNVRILLGVVGNSFHSYGYVYGLVQSRDWIQKHNLPATAQDCEGAMKVGASEPEKAGRAFATGEGSDGKTVLDVEAEAGKYVLEDGFAVAEVAVGGCAFVADHVVGGLMEATACVEVGVVDRVSWALHKHMNEDEAGDEREFGHTLEMLEQFGKVGERWWVHGTDSTCMDRCTKQVACYMHPKG